MSHRPLVNSLLDVRRNGASWTARKTCMGTKLWLALIWILGLTLPAWSNAISLTGSLNPANSNDVLLVSFTLAGVTDVTIQSYGYGGTSSAPGGKNAAGNVIAPGGFDTYFSLFSGTGPSATFLISNDDGTCPPAGFAPACRDSQFVLHSVSAGGYTLAVSVFDNLSFAENLGTGTLGDGFIGLGNYFNLDSNSFRTSNYAIDFTAKGFTVDSVTETSPVPEPLFPAVVLHGAILTAAVCQRKRGLLNQGRVRTLLNG